MSSITPNWETAWTTTSISASAITDGSSSSTAAISNDLKSESEVSVTILYGSTATEGVMVYVLRDVDGTNYEATTDGPWGFMMPYTVSTTHRRAFTVSGDRISSYKIHLVNNTGASVTATVRYKQATTDVI